jgi:4-diphosphocytidyl-2-C-methyl-D-erythritol kinase
MQDNQIIYAPAKLNLFLKINEKRDDGYHNIRSGITFINLFNVVEIKRSKTMKISYHGPHMPENGFYSNCIIQKTLNFLGLKNRMNLEINIEKNIPVQAGLGSASADAAGLIKGLDKMQLIEIQEISTYASLGADIPSFLFAHNCLVRGMGELIFKKHFPKYYFLLAKPSINFSTKEMYKKIPLINLQLTNVENENENEINEEDTGNDFEKILHDNFRVVQEILDFLYNLNGTIFSRMTGSGSCCYAAFETKKLAYEAQVNFQSAYSGLWTFVGENNTINN